MKRNEGFVQFYKGIDGKLLYIVTGDTGQVKQGPCLEKFPKLVEGGTWK